MAETVKYKGKKPTNPRAGGAEQPNYQKPASYVPNSGADLTALYNYLLYTSSNRYGARPENVGAGPVQTPPAVAPAGGYPGVPRNPPNAAQAAPAPSNQLAGYMRPGLGQMQYDVVPQNVGAGTPVRYTTPGAVAAAGTPVGTAKVGKKIPSGKVRVINGVPYILYTDGTVGPQYVAGMETGAVGANTGSQWNPARGIMQSAPGVYDSAYNIYGSPAGTLAPSALRGSSARFNAGLSAQSDARMAYFNQNAVDLGNGTKYLDSGPYYIQRKRGKLSGQHPGKRGGGNMGDGGGKSTSSTATSTSARGGTVLFRP